MSRGAREGDRDIVYLAGKKTTADREPGKVAAVLQSDLLVDSLSALFLAAGLTMASTTVTVLEGGFWSCLGLCALSLVAVAFLSLRWWIAPAAATVLLAGATIVHALRGTFYLRLAYWSGFFQWAWNGAPYDILYSENGSLLLLKAALALAVTAAVSLLVRKLFLFPLVLGLATGAFVAIYAVGRADLSTAVCVSAAGFVILLPRVYARYVAMNSSGKGEKRASMQIIAVPAAVLALVLCLAVTPEDTTGWQSKGLTNFFTDLGYLLGGPFQSAPGAASNFSLSRLGLQPQGDRLGGPAELTDDKMLTVLSDRPVLLRGSVKDLYTGQNWAVGGHDGDFRHGSLFWRRYRREAFGLDKPLGGREARQLYAALTSNLHLDVTYNTNRFSTLFAAGNVSTAEFADGRISEERYFNMRSELYLHLRIPSGVTLDVDASVWNPRTPEFDEDFLRLETLALGARDEQMEQLLGRYTTLPDDLPEPVAALAEEITADCATPYEKARAIQAWLGENCTYTLEPPEPPEDTDFVAHFLETREGYCTYYASAMAVLARCAGLPSRYVTGFGLERDTGRERTYTATGKTAHAWAEIYFHGVGWMEFDPLSWNPESPLNFDAWVEPEREPAPIQADTATHDPDNAQPQPLAEASEARSVSLGAVIAILLGAIGAILLLRLGLHALMGRKQRAYELNRVLRKIPDMPGRLDHYYADILRQLSLMDLNVRTGETLLSYPGRIDRRIRLEEANLADVAAARMRQKFGDIPPAMTDLEAAARYHSGLEDVLRERMGAVAYFFRRAIALR